MVLHFLNHLLHFNIYHIIVLGFFFLQHREKIIYLERGWRVTTALLFIFAVDTLLKVALTEHRTDTKINPSGTKTLEVVLTQNRSVFSVVPGSDGCYIFLPFHYSFFFQVMLRAWSKVLLSSLFHSNHSDFL